MTDLIYNVENEKCLATQGSGSGMHLVDCNENDGNQQFSVATWDGKSSSGWNVDNQGLHIYVGPSKYQVEMYDGNGTYHLDAINRDCNGYGWEQCKFTVKNDRNSKGGVGMTGGPFAIHDNYGGNQVVMPTTDLSNIGREDNNDARRWWMLYSDVKQCKQGNIGKWDCDASTINNCEYADNYKKDSCLAKVCSTNSNFLDKTECKSYCVSNPGACDTSASAYCTAHPTDVDFCGCQNYEKSVQSVSDSATVQQIIANPRCFIKSCAGSNSAYIFSTQKNPSCPSLTLCVNDVNVNSSSSNWEMDKLNLDNNCGTTTTTTSAAATTTTTTTTIDNLIPISGISTTMKYLILIMIVVVIGIIISSIVMSISALMFGGNSSNNDKIDPSLFL